MHLHIPLKFGIIHAAVLMIFPENSDMQPFSTDSETLYKGVMSDAPETREAAALQLYRELLVVARRVLWRQDDDFAHDCASEAVLIVFTKVWQCRDPRAFRGWACAIARHYTQEQARKSARMDALEEADEPPDEDAARAPHAESADPHAQTDAALDSAHLRAYIATRPYLSARESATVIGKFLDGLSDQEIAAEESRGAPHPLSPAHVQVARSRAIAKLRKDPHFHAILGIPLPSYQEERGS